MWKTMSSSICGQHPHSLIRAFTVHSQNSWILQNVWMENKDLDDTLHNCRMNWNLCILHIFAWHHTWHASHLTCCTSALSKWLNFHSVKQKKEISKHFFNPHHAEKIKMPRPFLIFSQSDYLIQTVDINSNTEWQMEQIRSQLIWIYTAGYIWVQEDKG